MVGVVVMAPLTMCLSWRCPRMMCLSSRHSWFRARCPSQGGLYNTGGTATLTDCQLISNLAVDVRGLFVDASSASCVPIEHTPSTTNMKPKALRLSYAHVLPLSPASLCFARATGTAPLSLRLHTQTALSRCSQNDNIAITRTEEEEEG